LNAFLLLVLVITMGAFVLSASSLWQWSRSPDAGRAIAHHRRLNLVQTAPAWNYYDLDSAIGSTAGAATARVVAALDARFDEVDGVTTTVYDLNFEARYEVRYGGAGPTSAIELVFPFPVGLDTLNGVYLLVDGAEPEDVDYSLSDIRWRDQAREAQQREITVRYRARGIGSFEYALERDRRLEHLDVTILVHGLKETRVPEDSLPATAIDRDGDADSLQWEYDALIADRNVRVELPSQRGFAQRLADLQRPLASLSRFSPVLVGLFVGSLYVVNRLSDIRLSSYHYLLAGLGYFLFYPLLSFLSLAVELPLAGALSSAAIAALLLIFLGRAAGWRRTWLRTLVLSVAFLGLLSVGALTRWRGVLVTGGGLVIVGTIMLLAAGHRGLRPSVKPAPECGEPQDPIETEAGDGNPVAPYRPPRHCPHCGAPLAEEYAYCPTCGHSAAGFERCASCGREQYLPPDAPIDHCPACGSPFSPQEGG
jgi:hypothetical protein